MARRRRVERAAATTVITPGGPPEYFNGADLVRGLADTQEIGVTLPAPARVSEPGRRVLVAELGTEPAGRNPAGRWVLITSAHPDWWCVLATMSMGGTFLGDTDGEPPLPVYVDELACTCDTPRPWAARRRGRSE